MPQKPALTEDDLIPVQSQLTALDSRVGAIEPAVTLLQAQVKLLIEKVWHLPDPPPEEEDPPAPPPPVPGYDLTRPLFAPSRLRLLGGWRVPYDVGGTSPTIAFMSDTLAARENADGTLTFWTCKGSLYEMQTAGPMGIGDPVTWPLVQGRGPADKTNYDPVWQWDADPYDPSPLGCHYRNGKIYVSGLSGYAAPVPGDPFLIRKDLATGVVEGPFGLPDGLCQVYGGGLFSIPKPFADSFLDGQDLGFGRGRYQSGQGSTAGSSAACARESALAPITAPADHRELIRYGDFGTQIKALRERRPADYSTPPWSPEADGLQTPDPSDDVGYCATDRTQGDWFWVDVPGCHGLCNFSLQGIGNLDYTRQTETFGADTRIRLYVYDPADIVKVARGELLPSQARHVWYDWPLPLDGVTDPRVISDAHRMHRPIGAEIIGNKLYVLYQWVWGGASEWWPAIAVYEIL